MAPAATSNCERSRSIIPAEFDPTVEASAAIAARPARAQLANLPAFIEEKNIVSIPSKEEALVAEAPPYNRANFAYIIIAGPYEKNLPSVYNIAPPDPAGQKPRSRSTYPARLFC
jgi:hypothetical protein